MTPEQDRILREYAAKYDGPLVVVEPPRPEAVAALLAERDSLKIAYEHEGGGAPYCAYCGTEVEREWDALEKHVMSCDQHPLSQTIARCELAESERDAALAKMLVLRDACRRVVEMGDSHDPASEVEICAAALASTPEIVAVVDGWTFIDCSDFTYSHCVITKDRQSAEELVDGQDPVEIPVRAIIVKAQKKEDGND